MVENEIMTSELATGLLSADRTKTTQEVLSACLAFRYGKEITCVVTTDDDGLHTALVTIVGGPDISEDVARFVLSLDWGTPIYRAVNVKMVAGLFMDRSSIQIDN